MRLEGEWLSRPQTQAVLGVLAQGGHRALVVGGAVRNAVMGLAASDVDISTDAVPERVKELAEAAGLKVVPTGIDHGTVTVISGGMPFEVTTFRRDVETDGRRAVVAYSTEIADDARRRDFTMNALYAEADGTLVDPLGGLADAEARRVRFIEDAGARIREDFLRILRFFRFHAWYGDEIDAEGLAACAEHVAGLDTLSRERIGAEFLKLLSAPDPAPAVASLAATGGLARILPGADSKALPVLVALEAGLGLAPDPLRRLSVLGGEEVAERLRFSRDAGRRLSDVRAAMERGEGAEAAGYRYGRDVAVDAGLVSAALLGATAPADLVSQAEAGAARKFPVFARDLMPDLSGAELGKALKALEERWIASGFALGREALLRKP